MSEVDIKERIYSIVDGAGIDGNKLREVSTNNCFYSIIVINDIVKTYYAD